MTEPISPEEQDEMRRILEPLFGSQARTWRITLRHYELLGVLLEENKACTAALHWVPRPYDLTNPQSWAFKQVRNGLRRALLTDRNKTYVICSRASAYKWATPFREASFEM